MCSYTPIRYMETVVSAVKTRFHHLLKASASTLRPSVRSPHPEACNLPTLPWRSDPPSYPLACCAVDDEAEAGFLVVTRNFTVNGFEFEGAEDFQITRCTLVDGWPQGMSSDESRAHVTVRLQLVSHVRGCSIGPRTLSLTGNL